MADELKKTGQQAEREAFELALASKPHARLWNTTDAMFWAWQARAALAQQDAQAASQPSSESLNAICKMFHHGEEVESDDGLAMLVPIDLWHDALEALEAMVGDDETDYAAPTPPAQHPDDAAVDAFAQAMKEKLAAARTKGRGGWQDCPPQELSRMLREHVEKGDPRDVANFCMFLWSLGHGIAAPTPPAVIAKSEGPAT